MQNRKNLILCLTSLLLFILIACNFPVRQLPGGFRIRPSINDLPGRLDSESWVGWIRRLSGEEPVTVGGEPVTIQTRYNYAMFTGQPNARAFEYTLEQVLQWVPAGQVEIDEYPYTDAERTYTWKNLIVTLPGTTRPQEVVILSAHLDSIVVKEGNAMEYAPGANDNGTGVATLFESIRLLKDYDFARTIRMIYFTGEESGLAGSRAYVADHDLQGVIGGLNLDMFGYDSNGDRCLELHAGTLPAASSTAASFMSTAQENNIAFSYDLLTTGATDRSDHTTFWQKGVGVTSIIENFFDDNLPGGCVGVDGNPYYHRPSDTVEHINQPYAFDIARTAILTTARLAEPIP